ncbi:MAG: hypothetical protein QXT88_03870 [Desulfurococcaceae archaeon]|uniref:Uncharacterized protein n=1 Tax=Staphylothermus marinus TaxID=2280 RepID=A0A7C4H9D3_STAMA
MTRNWIYDWMISCPAILVLGETRYRNYKGLVTLTLLYPRAIVMSREGSIRVINTIPEYLHRVIIEEICLDMLENERKDMVGEAFRKTMFYGGYNVFLMNNNGYLHNVVFELVNTSKIFLYIRRIIGKLVVSSLEHWILFGVGLRTGDFQLVIESCSEIGRVEDDKCYIESMNYELLVTNVNVAVEGFTRIIPDNNPARHVVKL